MQNPYDLLNTKTEDKEALYQELEELCLDLGIPYFQAWIDITYGYPNEKPKRLWEQPKRAESWVRNAYNQMMCCLGSLNMSDAGNYGTGFMSIKDTSGEIRSALQAGFGKANTEDTTTWIRAFSADDNHGVLVGSDGSDESFEHFNLLSQLKKPDTTHAAMAIPSFAQVGLTSKVSYSRTLTNASGGQLTYREAGLVAIFYVNATSTTYYFMLSRDLIKPALTLNNTGYLVPTYTMSLTYPSYYPI